MKRLMALSLCFSAAAALAGAEVRAQYRIVMRDGKVVAARDLPKQNGSVTMFHAESGALTGVPTEDVVRVDTSVTPKRFTGRPAPAIAGGMDAVTRPLQPGEVMVLGPIGDGGSGASIAAQAGAAGAAPAAGAANGMAANGNFVNGNGTFSNGTSTGTAFDARMLGGGTPAAATGLLPNGQPANSPLAGDVLRAQSGNVPTMSIDTQTQTSPNGFAPNAASQTTTLNPNGTANTTTTGPVAGSTAPIGPNGFPGTPQNVTAPNGFPTTGGASTAAQNVTGQNGFPAPAGSTPQNVTNPNGFPATGATGTGTTGQGQVIVAPNGTVTNVPPNSAGANQAGTATVPPPPQQQQQQQQPGTPKSGAAPNGPAGQSGAAPPSSSAPSGGPGR
jgi:hypothetical protein